MRIGLYRNAKSLLGRTIRFRTWNPYHHVDLQHVAGERIEAWWPGGVQLWSTTAITHSVGTVVDVVDVACTYRQDQAIWAYALEQLGSPYDVRGVLKFVSRLDPNPERAREKWFCSELVAEAFLQGGIRLLNKPSWRMSPGDVAASPMPEYVHSYRIVEEPKGAVFCDYFELKEWPYAV